MVRRSVANRAIRFLKENKEAEPRDQIDEAHGKKNLTSQPARKRAAVPKEREYFNVKD
jgi:hypothetical protein